MGLYYMPTKRGEIYNPGQSGQLRDYSGLLFGNITPTDIDGIIEYKNIGYVIIELKYAETKIPFGQRLALERLTDDLQRSGKPAVCLIVIHETPELEIIDVGNSFVHEYRYKGKWAELNLTTAEFITRFIKRLEDRRKAL